jgi:hypothetical protein
MASEGKNVRWINSKEPGTLMFVTTTIQDTPRHCEMVHKEHVVSTCHPFPSLPSKGLDLWAQAFALGPQIDTSRANGPALYVIDPSKCADQPADE